MSKDQKTPTSHINYLENIAGRELTPKQREEMAERMVRNAIGRDHPVLGALGETLLDRDEIRVERQKITYAARQILSVVKGLEEAQVQQAKRQEELEIQGRIPSAKDLWEALQTGNVIVANTAIWRGWFIGAAAALLALGFLFGTVAAWKLMPQLGLAGCTFQPLQKSANGPLYAFCE